ncbi:uncharacterized protein LOC114763871 isoform X2 [Denticeps clupeoides]|uniref:uncharacterized protein LOC114763871 isoform X2 n=1 Tax=Denticeps clupeoides TaxID=299321 RepID=UPI0010A4290C|nr:uncharacterized protein LOC114763871 isoform X2 [Denticeps clupeoides]
MRDRDFMRGKPVTYTGDKKARMAAKTNKNLVWKPASGSLTGPTATGNVSRVGANRTALRSEELRYDVTTPSRWDGDVGSRAVTSQTRSFRSLDPSDDPGVMLLGSEVDSPGGSGLGSLGSLVGEDHQIHAQHALGHLEGPDEDPEEESSGSMLR